ncbi:MAG: hypothetical protein GX456_19805 [Verrucomicrobia bacterium]|nr:hypothetical protein [Verrucomicrobiota bacterium]
MKAGGSAILVASATFLNAIVPASRNRMVANKKQHAKRSGKTIDRTAKAFVATLVGCIVSTRVHDAFQKVATNVATMVRTKAVRD